MFLQWLISATARYTYSKLAVSEGLAIKEEALQSMSFMVPSATIHAMMKFDVANPYSYYCDYLNSAICFSQ